MIKKIAIENIQVGLPLFLWLLDRMDDDYFKDEHWDIYGTLCDSGFYSKESYLNFLEENNLVQDLGNKKRKVYTITEKGLRVVGVAKKINTLLPIFNEMHS